ncbi:MAG TPA: PKD domain-containing protein [Methanomicrobiales archaeon]|nr:PKD domain-containing protein [Methanomicrobiales archaeon]
MRMQITPLHRMGIRNLIRAARLAGAALLITCALFQAATAGDTLTVKGRIVATAAPAAGFSAAPLSGPAPLAVHFTDESTGDITAYAWDFGDGGTSALAGPAHTYTGPGTYTVRLTVTGPGGSDEELKSGYIRVTGAGKPPVAVFTSWPPAGFVPLTVRFTDHSFRNPTRWSWDFGDGGTSSLPNPVHTYQRGGLFRVRLTVSNDFGHDSTSRFILALGRWPWHR